MLACQHGQQNHQKRKDDEHASRYETGLDKVSLSSLSFVWGHTSYTGAMIRTLKNPLLLTFFAALTSGCAVVKTTVQPPQFQVQTFEMTRYSIPNILNPFEGQATFRMDVRVTNPNAFGLQIRRIQGDLLLDGQNFGQAVIPNLSLQPGGSSVVTTEFTLPVGLNLASKIADIAQGRRVDYLVKTNVQVDAGMLGTVTFDNIVVAQGNVN